MPPDASSTIRPAVTTSTPISDNVTVRPVLDLRGRNGGGCGCHDGATGGPIGGGGGAIGIIIGGGATGIGGGKFGGGNPWCG
ncbi:hypothetical protein GCM10029964_009690 [Kibdelosporangium lantanae]